MPLLETHAGDAPRRLLHSLLLDAMSFQQLAGEALGDSKARQMGLRQESATVTQTLSEFPSNSNSSIEARLNRCYLESC